jgi:hypothetical protein
MDIPKSIPKLRAQSRAERVPATESHAARREEAGEDTHKAQDHQAPAHLRVVAVPVDHQAPAHLRVAAVPGDPLAAAHQALHRAVTVVEVGTDKLNIDRQSETPIPCTL